MPIPCTHHSLHMPYTPASILHHAPLHLHTCIHIPPSSSSYPPARIFHSFSMHPPRKPPNAICLRGVRRCAPAWCSQRVTCATWKLPCRRSRSPVARSGRCNRPPSPTTRVCVCVCARATWKLPCRRSRSPDIHIYTCIYIHTYAFTATYIHTHRGHAPSTTAAMLGEDANGVRPALESDSYTDRVV